MTDLIFLDTETTGLDPELHEVWEMAYAINDGPVVSQAVPHQGLTSDPSALRMNGYYDRAIRDVSPLFDMRVREILEGNTIVGANPTFDAAFLQKRWGVAPWHYRMIDVESMALAVLEYDRPKGLKDISEELREMGYNISEPNHSAAGDVATTRDCYIALRHIQKQWTRDISETIRRDANNG